MRDEVEGCPDGCHGAHVGAEALVDVEEVDVLDRYRKLYSVRFWQSEQEDLLSQFGGKFQ